MLNIRKANERGHADYGWLNTYHTFSFNAYRDPGYMGFRALRVINEDRVRAGEGFGTHGHRDMEIISYVLEGALEHRDSMGNGSVLRPGEFQRISAGSGMEHSEFNPSANEPSHFYQIWLLPDHKGIAPSYEQKLFSAEAKADRLLRVASPDGRDGSLTIQQDAEVFLAMLESGREATHTLQPQRHAWVQVLRGAIDVNGQALEVGDGVAVSDEASLVLRAREPAEIMVFDLG